MSERQKDPLSVSEGRTVRQVEERENEKRDELVWIFCKCPGKKGQHRGTRAWARRTIERGVKCPKCRQSYRRT